MASDKKIHFGRYVRELRLQIGLSLKEFGEKVGITEKRVWDIEQMPEPQVNDRTLYGIARAAGMTAEALDANWKATPMAQKKPRKAGIVAGRRRIIRVDSDTFLRLEDIASRHKMTVEEYLSGHAKASTKKTRPITQPDPSSAPSGHLKAKALDAPASV